VLNTEQFVPGVTQGQHERKVKEAEQSATEAERQTLCAESNR